MNNKPMEKMERIANIIFSGGKDTKTWLENNISEDDMAIYESLVDKITSISPYISPREVIIASVLSGYILKSESQKIDLAESLGINMEDK